ncbi:uncharacterized protein FOMMEDRAFT_161838 [Fomitiporia mediterranea MF3/22]|uniref:uncharacterized protein n=1 Tax=Fomitiporia mediterranea (strain MF3/22) TaxID=694068 RepID=UPI0004407987|nr:uncharacterized protein FOMMEDRAFT_161838 [Fomitiporia mediterranea MF3/22]EJC98465.1 hypothetical protein FOMMEDRAFT_161838 [Fomitiporia mediterranea MF3/22]
MIGRGKQVALNEKDYGIAIKSPHCNKNITIKVGGKTEKGLLVDKCIASIGCIGNADAELTPVLYDAVAPDGTNTDPSKGKVPLLQGSWEFDD